MRWKKKKSKYIDPGAVYIEAEHMPDGLLKTLKIALTGELARIPSTTNNKRLSYNRALGRTIISNNSRHTSILARLTDAYFRALFQLGLSRLSCTFADTPVHVSLIAGSINDRCDSHNLSKALCDWLEDVGIVENDKRVECWPMRGRDHPAAYDQMQLNELTGVHSHVYENKHIHTLILISHLTHIHSHTRTYAHIYI